MFGYATDETPECMPLTLQLAHQMNKKIADLRRDGTLWWARPDSKTQVTAEYVFEGGACVPIRVHTVVVSCQHSEKVTLSKHSGRTSWRKSCTPQSLRNTWIMTQSSTSTLAATLS